MTRAELAATLYLRTLPKSFLNYQEQGLKIFQALLVAAEPVRMNFSNPLICECFNSLKVFVPGTALIPRCALCGFKNNGLGGDIHRLAYLLNINVGYLEQAFTNAIFKGQRHGHFYSKH